MLIKILDRTIFMQDTGHILFDAHGCGAKRREILDEQIKTGERSFKDVSEEMWGSLNVPFENGFEVMEKTLEIDPDFQEFHKYCIVSTCLSPIGYDMERIDADFCYFRNMTSLSM